MSSNNDEMSFYFSDSVNELMKNQLGAYSQQTRRVYFLMGDSEEYIGYTFDGEMAKNALIYFQEQRKKKVDL